MRLTTTTEWLFFHIWKQHPITKQSCPGVFLLDTIIYRLSKPYLWYYMTNKGQIARKSEKHIENDRIYEIFTSKPCPGRVVACHMTSIVKSTQSQNKQTQEIIQFEYQQDEILKQFLYQGNKDNDSLLQKFVIQNDGHNSIIKVQWSPQFYLMNRKTNMHTINDKTINLSERLCTFEGPEHLLLQDKIISPTITQDLEQICKNIAKHLHEVSGNNIFIQRMVLYFKLDHENRIQLLFCTSIKIKEASENFDTRQDSPILRIAKTSVVLKSILDKIQINDQGYIPNLLNQFKNHCSNCEQMSKEFYELPFSLIIKAYDSGQYRNDMTLIPEKLQKIIQEKDTKFKKKVTKTKEDEQAELLNFINQEEQRIQYDCINKIPILISKVYGPINLKRYLILIKNSSWLCLTTKVCMSCYLIFTGKSQAQRKLFILQKTHSNLNILKKPKEIFQSNIKNVPPKQEIYKGPFSKKGSQKKNYSLELKVLSTDQPPKILSQVIHRSSSHKRLGLQPYNPVPVYNNMKQLLRNQSYSNFISQTTSTNQSRVSHSFMMQTISNIKNTLLDIEQSQI